MAPRTLAEMRSGFSQRRRHAPYRQPAPTRQPPPPRPPPRASAPARADDDADDDGQHQRRGFPLEDIEATPIFEITCARLNIFATPHVRRFAQQVAGALRRLEHVPPVQPKEHRVRLPSVCAHCQAPSRFCVDVRRNDAICMQCGCATFLHEGSQQHFSSSEMRDVFAPERGNPLMRYVAQAANLPAHVGLDAADLYHDVRRQLREPGQSNALSTAVLLWVAHDVPRTASLQRRYVPGPMADYEMRERLDPSFELQECEYDRHSGRWMRVNFPCDRCQRVFSTRREAQHHAPCNPALHKYYAAPYVRVDALEWSQTHLVAEIQRQFPDEVHPRRYYFERLNLQTSYTHATNFHRAIDKSTRLVHHDGAWQRQVCHLAYPVHDEDGSRSWREAPRPPPPPPPPPAAPPPPP